ncbi:hypothetical protein [Ensifer sp. SSB1]|nr:hypothetical protein [Ensifer sp. SSB1]
MPVSILGTVAATARRIGSDAAMAATCTHARVSHHRKTFIRL